MSPRPLRLLSLLLLLSVLIISTNGLNVILEWGSRSHTAGSNTRASRALPEAILSSANRTALPDFDFVVSKRDLTIASTSTGDFFVWGKVGNERLLPSRVSSSLWRALSLMTITRLEAAEHAFFALDSNGRVYSWSWGTDTPSEGLLGRTIGASSSPTNRRHSEALDSVKMMDSSHETALDQDSIDILSEISLPGLVQLNQTLVSDLQCNDLFCLALNQTQSGLFIWGRKDFFNSPSLGFWVPGAYDRDLPFELALPTDPSTGLHDRIHLFATGPSWYFFVTTDFEIYSSGPNDAGQTGQAGNPAGGFNIKHDHTSTLFSASNLPLSIAAGSKHALYLVQQATNYRIYAWGDNSWGQLGSRGSGAPANSATPIEISIPTSEPLAEVSATLDTSFVLTAFGEIFVWGATHRCADMTQYECGENGFGLFGSVEPFSSSHIPQLIQMPYNVIPRELPRYVLSFLNASEALKYQESWSIPLIAIYDPNAPVPVAPPRDSNSIPTVAVWGSKITPSGSPYPNMLTKKSIPAGNPDFDPEALEPSVLLADLPGTALSHGSLAVAEGQIAVILQFDSRVNSTRRLFSWGTFGPNSTLSLPYFDTDPSGAISAPPTNSSYPLELTEYLNSTVSEDPKHNITSIAIFAAPDVYPKIHMLSLNGRLTRYSYQVGQTPKAELLGTFTDEVAKVICEFPACAVLSPRENTLHTYLPLATTGTTDPAVGRSSVDQIANPPTALRQIDVGSEIFLAALGRNMGVMVVNDTENPVLTWGAANVFNTLGAGPGDLNADRWIPTPIHTGELSPDLIATLSDVAQVCAGKSHVLMLTNRHIVAWGGNYHGQAGPFYLTSPHSSGVYPSVIPASFFKSDSSYESIACVGDTSFAMLSSTVYVWGLNGPSRLYGGRTALTIYDSINLQQASTMETTSKVLIGSIISSTSSHSVVARAFSTQYIRESTYSINNLLFFGTDTFTQCPTTSTPGEVSLGSVQHTETGDIVPTTTAQKIVRMVSTQRTRYYLTSANQLYAAGDLTFLTTLDYARFPYNVSDLDQVCQSSPVWIHTFTTPVKDMQAFSKGIIILLNNGTVFFWESHSASTPSITLIAGHGSVGPQQVPINATIISMSCDYLSCCFSTLNSTLFCYGSLQSSSLIARDSSGYTKRNADAYPVGDLHGHPSMQFDNQGLSNLVMASRGGFVSIQIDSRVHFVSVDEDGVITDRIDITGSEYLPQLSQMDAGYGHIALLANGLMYVSGLDDMPNPYQSSLPQTLGNLTAFHQDRFRTVSSMACWTFSVVWLTPDGNLWSAGLELIPSLSDWKPAANPSWRFSLDPILLPYDKTSYTISELFSRRVWDEAFDEQAALPKLITVSGVKIATAPVPTPSVRPSPQGQCTGTKPFAHCSCDLFSNSWLCRGSLVVNGPVTIDSPTIILGSLQVSTDQFKISIKKEHLDFSSPILILTGCASFSQPIALHLDDRAVKNISKATGLDLVVVESGCYQSQLPMAFALTQEHKCKRLTITSREDYNYDNARISLVAILRVQRDTCSYWWIILVGIIASALVALGILFLLFYTTGTFNLMKQPKSP